MNKWLNEEVHVQAKVISQLESLLKDVNTIRNTKTKSLCKLGHKWCKIDHSMYNYVSRSIPDKIRTSRSQSSRSVKMESLGPRSYLGNISLATMCKKIDHFQSRYGMPPVSRQNVSEDLIHPVFASIWENVVSFKHNVLDTADKTLKRKSATLSKPKKKMAYKFNSSVIMETRPFNIFKEEKVKKTSKKSSLHKSCKPMTDAELAKALCLDFVEIKEYEKPDDELYQEIIREAIERDACRFADKHGDFYAPTDESENDEVEMPSAHGNYQLDDCKPPDDQEPSPIVGNENDIFVKEEFYLCHGSQRIAIDG